METKIPAWILSPPQIVLVVVVALFRSRFLRHLHSICCFLRSRLFSPRKPLCQHCSVTEDDDDHADEDDQQTSYCPDRGDQTGRVDSSYRLEDL